MLVKALLGDKANESDNDRELRNEIEFLYETDPLLFSTVCCRISLGSCSSRIKAASAGVSTRNCTGEFFGSTGEFAETFGNRRNRTVRAPLDLFRDFSTDFTIPLIPVAIIPESTRGQLIHTFLLILTTISPG